MQDFVTPMLFNQLEMVNYFLKTLLGLPRNLEPLFFKKIVKMFWFMYKLVGKFGCNRRLIAWSRSSFILMGDHIWFYYLNPN